MITPEQLAASGSEHGFQAAVFCWANLNLDKYPELKYMFSIPNGFYSTAGQKSKMKVEGLKSGVPDIMLPVKKLINGKFEYSPAITTILYSGLFIEMKSAKGVVSEEQEDYIDFLTKQGYKCEVCYSWTSARDVITNYLGNR